MDIDLIAYIKKYNDFTLNYKVGDERKLYNGKSLLFYSLANNDADSRYSISSFLLDKGIDVRVKFQSEFQFARLNSGTELTHL